MSGNVSRLFRLGLGAGAFLFAASMAAAETASISVKVSLTPAGSFEVTSKSLSGRGIKKGSSYTASELSVPVRTLSTGMSLRDEHLREKLNEKKYPNIVVKDVKASGGAGSATIAINGVNKKLSFKYQDLGGGFAKATFPLNLPDFNIEGINYKGVGVDDEVEVSATVAYDAK